MQGLGEDIDSFQFRYFLQLSEAMTELDRVVLCCHEPDWVIDAYEERTSAPSVRYLLALLGGCSLAAVIRYDLRYSHAVLCRWCRIQAAGLC